MDSKKAEYIDKTFKYDGTLGVMVSENETEFSVWAPEAEMVSVCLYKHNEDEHPYLCIRMTESDLGVWRYTHSESLYGIFYTYKYTYGDKTTEGVDPYARAAGVNGDKGCIVDPSTLNPEGWDDYGYVTLKANTDAIIYEVSVRDFSVDESSGIEPELRGKFPAFAVEGSSTHGGEPTCLSHIKDLGVTHVQLMPVFDFDRLDEAHPESSYNWGYDPENYNIPEGSYSTNPFDPSVRIKEYKELVLSLHKHGIGVVMDVVYNHTFKSIGSYLSNSYPGYYYRYRDSKLSNGSGCGNEIASERAMVRKYIVDSVVYWATEYKIDGFRFDLMACLDIDTINEISKRLTEINPNVILYGEGWTGGDSALPGEKSANKYNSYMTPYAAYFNDNYRDAIKGGTFVDKATGYISGNFHLKQSVADGILGKQDWNCNPCQIVNYVEAHDNLTLWDKLTLSSSAHERDRRKMARLAAALVFLAQGIPFIQAGQEFLRSKPLGNGDYDRNSYRSPDSVNSLKWWSIAENKLTVDYYKGLIAFRKAHHLLRLSLRTEVLSHSKTLPSPDGTIMVHLFDENEELLILVNPIPRAKMIGLPDGEWQLHITDIKASLTPLATYCEGVFVPPISAMVLKKLK
ncbi:MAG: type I pullulanase [Oscillospiraceae bacterium]|nr:type I pullulanase [Oscillospiraceae bacterium]